MHHNLVHSFRFCPLYEADWKKIVDRECDYPLVSDTLFGLWKDVFNLDVYFVHVCVCVCVTHCVCVTCSVCVCVCVCVCFLHTKHNLCLFMKWSMEAYPLQFLGKKQHHLEYLGEIDCTVSICFETQALQGVQMWAEALGVVLHSVWYLSTTWHACPFGWMKIDDCRVHIGQEWMFVQLVLDKNRWLWFLHLIRVNDCGSKFVIVEFTVDNSWWQ